MSSSTSSSATPSSTFTSTSTPATSASNTPTMSAIPTPTPAHNFINTLTPASVAPLAPPPPIHKPATKRLRFLGEHLGYATDDIPDPELLKRLHQQKPPWKPTGPFRFFDLPAELRVRVLEFALLLPHTLDLDPDNRTSILPRLDLFQVSRRMHSEAFPIFYGRHTFRLFPLHARFFHLKRLTVITRLPKRYRRAVTSAELRVGPGWQSPPDWRFGPLFGLKDCTSLRHLRVFVEVDPSHAIFRGFRIDEGFYTAFVSRLLVEIFKQVPSLEVVEFDAYPSVTAGMPLMAELLEQTRNAGKFIAWGPERGWDQDPDRGREEEIALAKTFAALGI